ncbi:MAG: S9 family peptidase [Caulobacteraceae bacterium]
MKWRACILGLLALAAPPCASHAAPLPIEAFFAAPTSRGAQLSPSGRYVALVETSRGEDAVSIIDLDTRSETIALKPRGHAHVDWVRWKGDDRLVAGLVSHDVDPDDQSEDADLRTGETLAAIDRDGKDPLILAAGRKARAQAPGVRMADPLKGDPSHVLVVAPDDKGAPAVWKVDVRNGAAEFVRGGDDNSDERLPPGAMVVRYRYDHQSKSDADFDILGPAPGGKRAYVALAPHPGGAEDTASVRLYDFDHDTFSDPLWPALKYDVTDLIYHEGDLGVAGVCYTADAFTCDFRDKVLEADYRTAAKALGAGLSVRPLSMSDDGRWWLLGVSGPNEPGAYYLMDRKSGRLSLVADRFPTLPARRLAKAEPFTYTARDGMQITGYLTRPPGAAAGPMPLIVMPHGGPEARDTLGYDIWAQFLATRGYLVFQPNFRGSSGYGLKFIEAGYRQWGAKMQDDITDGVMALIDAKQVDAGRICIFGASYGGYAALYGGAIQPNLYKCAASFAGVSDLNALVEWEHRTKGHEGRYRYAVEAIGDPAKDGARLKAASPIVFAASYRTPVLLIHGSDDQSVPAAQSQVMAAALKRAGKDARLTVFQGEGHTDWSQKDEAAALTEVAAFVESHIAPAPAG